MKVTTILAGFLMISATSAMAEGMDCAGKYSASAERSRTTASVERSADKKVAATVVAQDNSDASKPAAARQ